ncbi:7-cyano-7-deazaguanine synthase [hydrothermal vent metagenome]|uniref:7-cyano-7-deazaguanine synthase n=1 Tax=hydrothermal vent metagenome TaxID=652676 RepID=A0A3B1BXS1_9ZZZZ
MKNAVVLLSGGLDSATILAIAKSDGYEPYTLSFDYGQRHRIELDRAQEISRVFCAAGHKVVTVDLTAFGGSALTSDTPVPKRGADEPMSEGIPVTYVPARNTVFLSMALAYAETIETGDIFIGVNALDYSGYPDCRPEYILAFQKMANLATKGAVEGRTPVTIHTPLIRMTKARIIKRGVELGVDYSITLSCYDPTPDGAPCGGCDSCRLRAKGFAEAGMDDPAIV